MSLLTAKNSGLYFMYTVCYIFLKHAQENVVSWTW